jgi:hypothetical protein
VAAAGSIVGGRCISEEWRDLTFPCLSVEDVVHKTMKLRRWIACSSTVAVLGCVALGVAAQDPKPPDSKAPPTRTDVPTRLTIEVTGGEKDAPVENASVYVKYFEEHLIKKDKKVELNVKTNREGVAHVPNAPLGRALVQVIAEGWKTYGRWYDITDPKQTIKVRLEKPAKWY